MVVGWPVVIVGGWCPVGGHVGVGGLALWRKTDRLTFEVGLCLDLSNLAPGPKEPLGLGPVACPALESHLQANLQTHLTLKRPGMPQRWMPDANWMISVPLKMLSRHRHLSQPAQQNNIGPLNHPLSGASYCTTPKPEQVWLFPLNHLR